MHHARKGQFRKILRADWSISFLVPTEKTFAKCVTNVQFKVYLSCWKKIEMPRYLRFHERVSRLLLFYLIAEPSVRTIDANISSASFVKSLDRYVASDRKQTPPTLPPLHILSLSSRKAIYPSHRLPNPLAITSRQRTPQISIVVSRISHGSHLQCSCSNLQVSECLYTRSFDKGTAREVGGDEWGGLMVVECFRGDRRRWKWRGDACQALSAVLQSRISSDRALLVNFLDRTFLMLTERNPVFVGLSTVGRHTRAGSCHGRLQY